MKELRVIMISTYGGENDNTDTQNHKRRNNRQRIDVCNNEPTSQIPDRPLENP